MRVSATKLRPMRAPTRKLSPLHASAVRRVRVLLSALRREIGHAFGVFPFRHACAVLCLAALGGAVLCPAASAQEFGRMSEQIASGTSYRIFARPGDATVQVVVVSDRGSGVYEVPPETDLGKLVALTGGLGEGDARRARGATVRLLRAEGGVRRAVYEAPMQQLLLEPGRHPTLLEGDVLTVEPKRTSRFGWRDVLSIATAASTLTWTLRALLTGN